MTDKFSILGGAIQDAVQEAGAGALPNVSTDAATAAASAAATAKSWAAAVQVPALLLLPATMAVLLLH